MCVILGKRIGKEKSGYSLLFGRIEIGGVLVIELGVIGSNM